MQTPKRLAVLIDAENANASGVAELMAAIEKFGVPIIKRAYGDWTTPQLTPWKKVLLAQAIKPCQQFRYSKGKNSSDCALIVDAMDIIHAGSVDGLCIVSSDSDYTGLAARAKEGGFAVYGFGTSFATQAFRSACDEFVLTDGLKVESEIGI